MPIISAKDVFKKYAQSIPVYPDKIAKAMGIVVRGTNVFEDSSLAGVSGAAYIDEGTQEKVILYNPLDPVNRQRFTIAHELGHHLLGHTVSGVMLRDLGYTDGSPKETDANNFAAELLVPMEYIAFAHKHNQMPSVADLARAFQVSESVVQIRLARFYQSRSAR